jgi:hypothetical protein
VRFKPTTTLSYLKEQLLKSEDNNVESVEFYTISGSKIPLCETVKDLKNYPIQCQINKNRIFAINFSYESNIS